jgi:hypothetical protein
VADAGIQGLSYSAIIIRVGLGIAERSGPNHTAPASMQLASRTRQHTVGTTSTGTYPLKIAVTQHVDRSTDDGAPRRIDSGDVEAESLKVGDPWGGVGNAA